MALLMGICYLANPLHQQIRTVFHEISHLVESPETLPTHHSHTNDHNQGAHEHSEHHMVASDHRHTLLDLMDSLFDVSDEQNTEDDTVLTHIQWDKHISSPKYMLPQIIPIITSQDNLAVEQKVRIGYLALPDEPPRNFFPAF